EALSRNTEPFADPASPHYVPLTPPRDAAASMRFPNSQHAEQIQCRVFASEPDIANPIDLAWDHRGRLWVAQNFTYAKRGVAFRSDLRDRLTVLVDEDADGIVDHQHVFLDDLDKLTSVEVGRGGVWLMTPPRLLFIPLVERISDASTGENDRDIMVPVAAGPARVILDGFTVADANYHNFANGLRFGPDGWLYGRCGGSCPGKIGRPGTPSSQRIALEGGLWRYHVDEERFEVLTHGTTNPWGHDFNELGDLFFINTVNGHLWHGLHGAHFKRPFTLDPNPLAYELIDQHADHYHFDTTGSWTKSRDGAANDFGGGHAHSGMMIYRETGWPKEFHGDLFTLNFHGRRINREILRSRGSGYVGSHGSDLMLADDVWFRGMELTAGPDGNIFIADWSDLGECHEHTGVHRDSGRIYKLVHQSNSKTAFAQLASLQDDKPDSWLPLLTSEDRWFRRQARLRLSQLVSETGSIDSSHWDSLHLDLHNDDLRVEKRLRSLWAIHAVNKITQDDLVDLLQNDSHDAMRVWALRLLTQHWPIDDCYGPTFDGLTASDRVVSEFRNLEPLLTRLAESDPSARVRGELASLIQRLPGACRSSIGIALSRRDVDQADHNIQHLIWYGLMSRTGKHGGELATLLRTSRLTKLNQWAARAITEHATDHPQHLDEILGIVTRFREQNADDRIAAIMVGVQDGLAGIRRLSPGLHWNEFQSAMLDQPTHVETLNRLDRIYTGGESIERLLQTAVDNQVDILKRAAAIEGIADGLSRNVSLMSDAAKAANEPTHSLPSQSIEEIELIEVVKSLIRDPRVNVRVAKAVHPIPNDRIALSLGQLLIENLRRFRAPQRPKIIAMLCTRVITATQLLDAVEDQSNDIDIARIDASHARAIDALGDAALTRRLESLWGQVRTTPAERQKEIHQYREAMTPTIVASADLSSGRKLFEQHCSACHRLYDVGGAIGPNLTGAQRDSIDYWLENIVDPDAVVSANYRATKVLTVDGRVVVGLVTKTTPSAITIVAADQTWVIPKDDIEDQAVTSQSPMPSGLLSQLDDDAVRDLLSYLMHPRQVF
ncbi:MAG: PVC-type heme-binding CxxCH protein, partial [Planctomycetota bacterium]